MKLRHTEISKCGISPITTFRPERRRLCAAGADQRRNTARRYNYVPEQRCGRANTGRLWTDAIVHSIHRRVFEHVKQLVAEADVAVRLH